MEKKKIIYDIREGIRAYSQDAKTTNAYILHLVNTVRAKYIRQDQKRNPGEDKLQFTQTFWLETELVDRTYDSSLPANLKILRTKKPLPQLVGKDILKSVEVRPVDRISYELEFMDKDRAIYGKSELFIFCFIDDDYKLYFVNKDNNLHNMLKKVAVTAVLFQPDDITDLMGYTEELVEYPISGDMWALVKPEVLRLVLESLNVPIDTDQDNQTVQ